MTEEPANFTEFMIETMQGRDDIRDALVIYRKEDGTIGYRAFNQFLADTIGLLRYTQLSVESDLIQSWKSET